MATTKDGKPLTLSSSDRQAILKAFEELGIKRVPEELRTKGYTITPLILYSKSTQSMLASEAGRSKKKNLKE